MSARYRILGRIGGGAMGEILVARDTVLGREVAVKRLHRAMAANDRLRARFEAEGRVTAQLDHPGIVPVYGIETGEGGLPQYAMKLVQGRTLEQVLEEARQGYARGGPDPEHDLPARLEIFLAICDAVAHAHERGVIHRDLKPENVMIGAFHQVLVMDWGIARPIGGAEPLADVDTEEGRAVATRLGVAIGTPLYMSPEQASGQNDVLDGRSDQYALGLLLQEVVTLRPAVSGPDPASVVARAQAASRDPMVHVAGERVPRSLAAIVEKATAPRPEDRYPDVAALAADVRRHLRDEPVHARPDGPVGRALRWIGRHRRTTLLVLLTLVAVGIVGTLAATTLGVALLEWQQVRAERREARLAELLGTASGQVETIDLRFQSFERQLAVLIGAAELALQSPPPEVPVYGVAEFADPGRAPPDLEESPVYRGAISVEHPDVVAAPDARGPRVARRSRQLAGLAPHLHRAQVRSAAEEAATWTAAERAALVREEGVPLVWAYVATEEGLLVGSPGMGDYPDDYDPRGRPWYLEAREKPGLRWSAADADESGLGLLVTCSTALHDAEGRFLGVAAVDLTFGYLIEELLDAPSLEGRAEAFLVDDEGRIVVRSTEKGEAVEPGEYTQEAFPWPAALARLRATGESGYLVDDGTLLVWSRMVAVPWTYVIVGDAEALLR